MATAIALGSSFFSRRDPNTPRQPYPFDLENPESQVEAILREKLEKGSSEFVSELP